MENNAEKHLEQLSRKIMGKSNLESPSKDFTVKLMSHIKAYSKSKAFVYKPLISKPVWVVLILSLASLLVYSTLFASKETDSPSKLLVWKAYLTEHLGNLFSGFQLSEITFYALILFCGMLYVQIFILKTQRHIEK